MDSDRKVRELAKKIFELSEKFDEKFESILKSGKYRKTKDLDISLSDDRFDERIISYGVNKADSQELKEMAMSLKNVEKLLEMKLKDIRKTKDKDDFEEIADEIQNAIRNSLFMQRLPADELQERIEALKYDPNVSRRAYIRNLKKEIEQLQYERDAARGMLVINKDPELKKVYDELESADRILEDEIEYRREHEEISLAYNSLCEAYQTLERINSRYNDPNLSDKERTFLEQEIDKVLPILYIHLSKENRDKVFSKDEGKVFNSKDIFKVLKEEIQDLAFEKNALNGIVDPDIVAKDYFDINKLDSFSSLEKIDDSRKLRELMNNNQIQNPDLREFIAKLRMKLLMQDLVGIYQKEEKLKQIDERLNAFNGKSQDQLTDKEIKEKQSLAKERGQIKTEINRISQKTAEIRQLGATLGIECIVDGSLDLNSQEAIKTLGIVQVDAAIKKQKDLAEERKQKLLTRYEIEGKLTPEGVKKQMQVKVKEIGSKRRNRIIDLEYKGDSKEESQRTVATEERTDEDAIIIQRMKVHDTQMQLDTIDDRYKQRVECGKVYRYVRGESDKELNFIEEDLEVYIDNPKKKLSQVLDGIRDRLINELGSEKELEIFCDENDDKEYLKDLVSKNPLKRFKAKRDFIKKIESANIGNEGMAYVDMAIALNSEVLPNSIVEVMSRTAQPYDRANDMKKYVKIREKRGVLGLTRRDEGKIYQARLVETDRKRERANEARENSYLNVRSEANGMVRPFEITDKETRIFEFDFQKRSHPKDKSKNNSKKRNSKSQDGEIE